MLHIESWRRSICSPLSGLKVFEEKKYLESLNRYNVQIVGPVSDSISLHSGSSAYQIRGADTLNFGEPADWVRSKGILADFRVSLVMLPEIPESYGSTQDNPTDDILGLIQHWEAATTIESQQAEKLTAMISQQEIEDQIALYEQAFGMSSDEFLLRVHEGTAPDTFEAMDWLVLLRHR
jgi:hypothetical protein